MKWFKKGSSRSNAFRSSNTERTQGPVRPSNKKRPQNKQRLINQPLLTSRAPVRQVISRLPNLQLPTQNKADSKAPKRSCLRVLSRVLPKIFHHVAADLHRFIIADVGLLSLPRGSIRRLTICHG